MPNSVSIKFWRVWHNMYFMKFVGRISVGRKFDFNFVTKIQFSIPWNSTNFHEHMWVCQRRQISCWFRSWHQISSFVLQLSLWVLGQKRLKLILFCDMALESELGLGLGWPKLLSRFSTKPHVLLYLSFCMCKVGTYPERKLLMSTKVNHVFIMTHDCA